MRAPEDMHIGRSTAHGVPCVVVTAPFDTLDAAAEIVAFAHRIGAVTYEDCEKGDEPSLVIAFKYIDRQEGRVPRAGAFTAQSIVDSIEPAREPAAV